MASPTPNKGFTYPAHGGAVNAWDAPLNADFDQIDAILGNTYNIVCGSTIAGATFNSTYATVSSTVTSITFPTSISQSLYFNLSGSLTQATALVYPAVGAFYVANNGLSVGSSLLTAKTAAGGSTPISISGRELIVTDSVDPHAVSPDLSGFPTLPLTGYYQGCNAGSYDSGWCYFNAGSVASADGREVFDIPLPLWINVNTTGINVGTPPTTGSSFIGGVLEGLGASPYPLQFYLFERDADGALAVAATSYDTYGDAQAVAPAGWTVKRGMHFAVYYVTGRGANWNGLPDFFQDVGGSTWVYLSGGGEDANFRALNAGSATSFFPFSVATFAPDGCRQFRILLKAVSTGSAGYVAIRPPGQGSGMFLYVGAGGTSAGQFVCKTDSIRNIEFLVSNANAYAYVLGYSFDNPT